MLLLILGPSSLPVVVAQPDERHANRTASVLLWYDRTQSITTSCSNEEDVNITSLDHCCMTDSEKLLIVGINNYNGSLIVMVVST